MLISADVFVLHFVNDTISQIFATTSFRLSAT